MQFSLKHLIFVTIFASIGVSIFIEVRAIRKNRTAATDIELKRKQLSANYLLAEAQSPNLRSEIVRLNDQIGDYESVRNSMKKIFAETAAAEREVVRRPNMLSVREIPLLDDGSAFRKRFRVAVPDEMKVQLRLRFTGKRGERDLPFDNDFEFVKDTTTALNSGLHDIDFQMFKASEQDDVSARPKLIICVDEKVAFETSFLHAETNGHSSRNYNYAKQKDYLPEKANKLPQLVHFRPSPGKTIVNLLLEQVELVETKGE